MKKAFCLLLSLLFACSLLPAALAAEMTVYADRELVRMSDTLYGLFFEDINRAADGGIYAELLENRSFEYEDILNPLPGQHYQGWQLTSGRGSAVVTVETESPLHENNPHYMRVNVTGSGYRMINMGCGGSMNASGMDIAPSTRYDASVWLRNVDFDGSITMRLVAKDGTPVSSTVTCEAGENWQKTAGQLKTIKELGDQPIWFALIFSGTGCVDVDMASLMPAQRTLSGLPGGGFRTDLVEALRELKPSFIRFPGGCVTEGSYYHSNFYNWKDTVGPVEERRENFNTWGYYQSYGLGYFEYFCLCEELGALPLPVVHAGMLCQMRDVMDAPYTIEETRAYAQDLLDLIEFAIGSPDTVWGGLRAQMGHEAPFDLRYLAIGNENFGDVYLKHFEVLSEIVKEAYPQITTVVSGGPWADNATILRDVRNRFPDSLADEHYYMDCEWFLQNTHRYDTYSRRMKIFLGEYAAHAPVKNGRRPNSLYSALCEAAYLTGIERNSDVVAMCCYAPLLARDGMQQWTPNLIWFNASQVLLTPNYHVQKMFAQTAGKAVLESECTGEDLYACATRKDDALTVKLVSVSDKAQRLTLRLSGVPDGEAAQVLMHGNPDDVNTFEQPDKVCPQSDTLPFEGGVMELEVPAYSVMTLTFAL